MAGAFLTPEEETAIVQEAVERKWMTAKQMREAIEIRSKAAELGLPSSMEEIVLKKSFLTAERWGQLRSERPDGTKLVIGGWEVLKKIGEGGMGSIFLVRKKKSDKRFALKLLSREVSKLREWKQRFGREAAVSVKLKHPHVVRGIEYGVEKERAFYVMEYVEGENFSDLLHEKGVAGEAKTLDWLIQMVEAVEYIHKQKLIHRDIKPENIIITTGADAKLTDLGLAKSVAQNSPQITKTGTAVGTPGYMSPEQIRGEKGVDIRTDIYSLGATFYFAFSGKKPFEGDSFQEVLLKHLNEQLPDPRTWAPRLREDIVRVIERMMAKDKKDRYRNPADLLKDLRAIKKGEPIRTREVASGASMVARGQTPKMMASKKSSGMKVLIILVILAAAGAGLLLLLKPGLLG